MSRNSLVVQWLGLHACTAQGVGPILGLGTKIPRASRHSQKKKSDMYKKRLSIRNNFNKYARLL